MAQRRTHPARLGLRRTTVQCLASSGGCGLVLLVVAVSALAWWPGGLWAQTMAPGQPFMQAKQPIPPVAPTSQAPVLSPFPSDTEIIQTRVFSMPLLPIAAPSAGAQDDAAFAWENRALAEALRAYTHAAAVNDVTALTDFLQRYPQSRWRAGLLAHLGRIYRHSGRFQHSIEAFEAAWALTKNSSERQAHTIANWAVGELVHMHAHLGHAARIDSLYTELNGRKLYGPATEQWTVALEALARRHEHPEGEARCGPMALASLLRWHGRDVPDFVLTAPATPHGFSLTALASLAQRAGLPLQPVKRAPGAPVPVPSVVHWQVDHYAAVVDRREENGRDYYLVENPLFEKQIWVSREVLDEETSGYFLAPEGELPQGWRLASQQETDGVWGGCWVGKVDLAQLMLDALMVALDALLGGCFGMAQYSFHAMLVSLHLEDVPLGYVPPLGPAVRFQVVYNQRDGLQPSIFSYANLGAKWTFNWLSYVTDKGPRLSNGQDITVYLRSGGQETYTVRLRAGQQPPLSFGMHYQSQAELVALGQSRNEVTGYERRLPDGSTEIFALPEPWAGGNDERRVFLTKVVDPAGNAVKLTYDEHFRIVAFTDALGQVTRVSYDLSDDPLKITQVTDPFGRSATFSYDAQGRLVKITDVIGITSAFTYDGDFVTALTTPYGTTTFRTGTLEDIHPALRRYKNVNRWLEATDPLGDTERLEVRATRDGFKGMPSTITLYWDKQAWQTGGRNDANARVYRWMLLDHTILSGVPWLVQPPLEGAAVYMYPGQPTTEQFADHLRVPASGADGLPATITTTLDDGTPQTQQIEHNARGRVTKVIDPAGRTFVFTYDTNDIDLLEVRNAHTNDRLMRLSYNAQHLPLTFIDAAGQSTTFTYNPQGQLLTVTNAREETTTFTYDAQGYLLTVTGPLPEAVTEFTYDDFARLHTVTDSAGYQLAFAYDALDRLTRVTYPDGTFARRRYDRLDPVILTDRQKRTTRVRYDALRRPVSLTDPLGRITQLRWCNCGSLETLIDPAGNVTTWEHDLQGRLNAKILADGATTRYVYAPDSGRLQEVIDPKGQRTTYQYTIDNNIRRIAFKNAAVDTAPMTFTYDPHYNRVVRVKDGIGTTHYAYHPPGEPGALQLASVTGQLPGSQTDYVYDGLGRVVRRAINGVASQVTYDTLGRVARLQNALGTFRLSYVGTTERLQSVRYPNGQKTALSYFDVVADQRLRRMRHQSPDGSMLSQFDYTYETTGEILTQERHQAELEPTHTTYTYQYDDASQLLAATLEARNGTLNTYEYAYDTAGNRLAAEVGTSHRAASFNTVNQLVSLQDRKKTWDFTYDANGNLLSDGKRTFEWDARDRLTAIVAGKRRSEFSYDGFDRRVRIVEKEHDAVVSDVWWLWCSSDICEQRILRQESSRTTKRFFSFGETDGRQDYFYTQDHLGSIRQMTDTAGTVVSSCDYDPYGRMLRVMGNAPMTFGFAGYFWHETSSLNLLPFRAYDPDLGRWLSRDPIAEDGGINLYGYVGNSPVNFYDPSGLEPIDVWDFVPVVGETDQAIHDFQTGHPYWGTFHALMAAGDSIPAKAGATAVVKTLGKGAPIALGLGRRGLTDFARSVNARYWGEWLPGAQYYLGLSAPLFRNVFRRTADQASHIHCNLDGINISRVLQRGSEGVKQGFLSLLNATNHEIYQILHNPEWLKKTTFYQGNIPPSTGDLPRELLPQLWQHHLNVQGQILGR